MLPRRLDDHEAHKVCNVLLQEAILQIRGTAYLQHHVGRPVGDVKFIEQIRDWRTYAMVSLERCWVLPNG